MSGPQRAITCKEAFIYSTFEGTHLEDGPGSPKPAAHAPLALRRSGPVLWTPTHPCYSQQIVAAANELVLSCRSSSKESVKGH